MDFNCSERCILEIKNTEKFELYLPVIVFMGLLFLMGTIGNIIVLMVYSQKKRKTSSHFFILTLSILDLFGCFFGIPTEIADLCNPYLFDAPFACRLLRFTLSVTTISSAIVLLEVAFDRYYRICKVGLQYSLRKTKLLCVVALFIGILLSWPSFVIFGKKRVEVVPGIYGSDCSTDDSVDKKYPTTYYGFLFLLFIICTALIFGLYVRLSLEVRKRKDLQIHTKSTQQPICPSQRDSEEPSVVDLSDETPENNKQRKYSAAVIKVPRQGQQIRVGRTTVILFAVSVIFVVSYLPFLIAMVVRNVWKDFESSLNPTAELIYKFCLKSYFLNNAINPIVYSFLNVNFRQEIPRAAANCFCKGCCKS
ncbi:orexin receptor type 2 [Octopus bimaculoides]|uniref:G-protein coupled receptors family 1 profile domain-containing protein n=1 Tax=Octopus bimaculoides TaxID=37653 RepID=A0A0L8HJF9_OCTBM|nr:orexin receptor type 2 [Octopus bimaculoides]XP_014772137.1 orexin receptor type 2 [Octopus bimaculoides]|eukprot:XP_014772136.1 PREDICTED: orexin receptor type 2-like [Octopus bimaculoides]